MCCLEKENRDKNVKRVFSLFSKDDWRERKAARKEAMKDGMARRRFQEIFGFCIIGGLLKMRTEAHNLKKVRRIASSSSLTAPIRKGQTGQTASQK